MIPKGWLAFGGTLGFVTALFISYTAGVAHQKARGDAALAKLQSAHDKQHAEDMAAFGRDLHAAIERGNTLSGRLSRAESALHKKNLEVHREAKKVTHNRACLDADAVWLLNNRAGELPEAPDLSAAAGQFDAAHGGAAGHTTDTLIFKWIANAKTQYGICRQRLNGLIDWHKKEESNGNE
ncbi:hypothetical protein QF000_000522 [Paraburkholderia atlantica]|uniref:hypothetical protein n=1 Tax=Paraburkholderia atlantica TaxID=2654982 RepID=UPI003D23F3AF